MAVLLVNHLRYDWSSPGSADNDHLILSKGHPSPLLYAMFRAAGVISEEELLTTYRRFGSRLQGHPTPLLSSVDAATRSLGQGLPRVVGIALAGKHLEKSGFHTWVLCGDGEMAEGSMWEALDKASYYKLGNLSVVIDVNRLGQRGPTELGSSVATRRAFGDALAALAARPEVVVLDGEVANSTFTEEFASVCRSASSRYSSASSR